MSAIRYALPALSLAASAYAQCSTSGTTTITNAAEVTACSTYSGSIALATDSAGSIDFGAVKEITGDLIAMQTNTTSLQGNSLETIGGRFALTEVLQLSSISFNQLGQIGTVDWRNVPQLGTLNFGPGVQQINNFTVADSQIQDLSNINLRSAEIIYIAQNHRLTQLNWQTTNITGTLTLDGNGQTNQGFTARFSNLVSAGTIVINDVSALDFSSLVNATQISIFDSTLTNLTFPNLTSIGTGGLNIDDDQKLSTVGFPELKTINGPLVITNNQDLTGNISFPMLTTVSSIKATGDFSDFSIPVIVTIAGGVNVSTTSTSFSCANINALRGNGVALANPACSSGPSAGDGSSGVSGGASGSHTGNAANHIELGTATLFGTTGLIAAMLGMI